MHGERFTVHSGANYLAFSFGGANQFFRANCANFNLGHRINTQWGRIESRRKDLQKCDYSIQGRTVNVDPLAQIEVSIICTEILVCT